MCKHIKDKKKITFFPTTPFALKKSKEYARREQKTEKRELREFRESNKRQSLNSLFSLFSLLPLLPLSNYQQKANGANHWLSLFYSYFSIPSMTSTMHSSAKYEDDG